MGEGLLDVPYDKNGAVLFIKISAVLKVRFGSSIAVAIFTAFVAFYLIFSCSILA